MNTTTNEAQVTRVKPWFGNIAHLAMVVPFSLNGATPTLTALCGTKIVRTTKIGAEAAAPCDRCFAR